MISGDTIVAISSATGAAARMIVRLSGPQTYSILQPTCPSLAADPRQVLRTRFHFASLAVSGWLYRFRSPRSFTGEDLAELHLPGNPLLARLLLEDLMCRGARPAEPGEFTARAYFNNRIDLTEAEGIAAAVTAHGEADLLAARQLLAGELAHRLRPLMESLGETLALVEAGIDFSEEDITFLNAQDVAARARHAERSLAQLVEESPRFERLSHEPRIVLTGRPNAGKSTLLNTLAGTKRALVSSQAGTTRDVIHAEVALDRGLVHVVDAAGLEEVPAAPDDDSAQAQIARQMHVRSLAEVERADVVVLLMDSTDRRPRLALPRTPDLIVLTKSDLTHNATALQQDGQSICISAHGGTGIDPLRRRLSELAFGQEAPTGALALNTRHRQAIAEARTSLTRAAEIAPSAAAELLAQELREALDALGRILGHMTPDDVLGRVFATFCIGK